MKILKESLFSTDSELVSYDEMDVDAVADPTYVDAINNRQKTIKELNKRFKDKEKERDDFVKQNHNTDFKPKTDKELKKLKLSESLFEANEYDHPEAMGRGTCAPLVFDSTRRIQQNLKYLNNEDERARSIAKKDLQVCIEDLEDQRQTVENFNTYWTTRYEASLNFIQAQLDLIPKDLFNESLEEDTSTKLKWKNVKDYYQARSHGWIFNIYPPEEDDEGFEINIDCGYDEMQEYDECGFETLEQAKAYCEEIFYEICADDFNESLEEDTAVLDKPETDIEVDFTPKDDTIYYKTKRQPLADIIMRELTSGEVVYKMGDSGKLNATHAPGLNLDEEDIGAKDDENGYYIIAWVATEDETKAVEAIANRFKRPFKTGYSKYAGEKPYFTKIYIEEKDWDEPYFDPDVPLRPSTKKRK